MKHFNNIGFGTYRISIKNNEQVESLSYALKNGITVIDTSTNYASGEAEQAIAKAFQNSGVDREEVTIVSKAGYIQGNLLKQVQNGIVEVFDLVPYQEGCYHSIHSDFIKDQISASLQRMETEYIDTYLLHNPEYFLMHHIEREDQVEDARKEMNRRILEAFIALEEEVQNGRIRSYGVSSNSFAKSPDSLHFLPYTHLLDLAEEAKAETGSSKHHFNTIQLPINLLETEGLKCAAWAKSKGLKVLANRPLNAFDKKGMHRLASYEKPVEYENTKDALLTVADKYSLSDLRSVVTDLDAITARFTWPGAAEEALQRHTIPFIQGVLAQIPDKRVKSEIIPLLNPFLKNWFEMVKHICSHKTLGYLHDKGFSHIDNPIQHHAIKWLMNRPEIDTVLLGMRSVPYVKEALTLL
ncbi:aldo/keto reductase [Hydrogenimonas thermophila]|uniref:aldo/keto reductase n=1 Tax=Hydrogenimonas thermophila TaxID=223786 RepID=UPI0029373F63|nr:aldo/keto reductase [Hydrogenimonas thermophila]WOE69803.1 aldo/keto reductase [Hydrogenimonas thermophila]WOE72318.1 aldo/keto reductase [Hydrogenimonas thermophila]